MTDVLHQRSDTVSRTATWQMEGCWLRVIDEDRHGNFSLVSAWPMTLHASEGRTTPRQAGESTAC